MADFSYSGDPLSCAQDTVRFLLGDTNEADPQLTDREIEFLLDAEKNSYIAASNGAHALAAKYGRMVDMSVGDLSYSYSQIQKKYTDLAATLMGRSSNATPTAGGQPYAGGISRSDKSGAVSNSDRAGSEFRKGMHDYDTSRKDDYGSNY